MREAEEIAKKSRASKFSEVKNVVWQGSTWCPIEAHAQRKSVPFLLA